VYLSPNNRKEIQDVNGKLVLCREEGSANISIIQDNQVVFFNIHSMEDIIIALKDLMPIQLKYSMIAKMLLLD
jgi:hypothetical protein